VIPILTHANSAQKVLEPKPGAEKGKDTFGVRCITKDFEKTLFTPLALDQ